MAEERRESCHREKSKMGHAGWLPHLKGVIREKGSDLLGVISDTLGRRCL
jgi:hypothetical protein